MSSYFFNLCFLCIETKESRVLSIALVVATWIVSREDKREELSLNKGKYEHRNNHH